MKQEIEKWFVDWFKERNQDKYLGVNVEEDFYKRSLVDSFGIIELIDEMESHFSIRFDDSDFQLAKFRTIKGLAEIIEQKAQ